MTADRKNIATISAGDETTNSNTKINELSDK